MKSFRFQLHSYRGDYKFAEIIGQKPSIAILSLNLVGHPIQCSSEMMCKCLDV